jgi:hypothetical protein
MPVQSVSAKAETASRMRTPLGALAPPRLRDRDVVLAFLAGLAVALWWRSSLVHWKGEPWAFLLLWHRSGISAEVLAIATLAMLAFRFRGDEVLSRSDLAAIGATALAFALPFRLAAIVPVTAVGLKLAFQRDERAASAGQILLAFAFYEWVGPIIFHLVSPLALKAEAVTVFALLAPLGGFARDGLVITAPGGHTIFVEEGCSAFHNLSLSTLIWICLVKFDTLAMKAVHYWICAAMAAATVALNTLRMALMAQSLAMYQYWHNDAGAPLLTFMMLAVILAICLGGLRYSEPS